MAITVDDYSLISGAQIDVAGVHVRQPTLGDIREIGYVQYRELLSSLLIDKDTILKILGLEDDARITDITVYDLFVSVPELQSMFIRALSFFVVEPVSFDGKSFTIDGCVVGAEQLNDIKKVIFEVSYVAQEDQKEELNFPTEAARKIWEKIQRGREASKKASKDERTELPNLISAICAMHSSYNLLNIWSLTVYQVYDQFKRMNVNHQMTVIGQRWATWGKDADGIDFTAWFQKNSNKGDK